MKSDGEGEPLILFSGDALSPSALSMVTRGSHMIQALNALGTVASALGNHDLDDGLENFELRSAESKFPWLATNVDYHPSQARKSASADADATVDAAAAAAEALRVASQATEDADEVEGAPREHGMVRMLTRMESCVSRQAEGADAVDEHTLPGCKRYAVVEHAGVTIGLIGLIEDSWLATLSSVDPRDLEYEDFVECARWWSQRLRADHGCDLVIALTHMRLPRDLHLGRVAHAVGVDLVLGGHDHFYSTQEALPAGEAEAAAAASKPVDPSPDASGVGPSEPGACLVVKSGTDFRELTDVRLDVRLAAPLDAASVTGRGAVVGFRWERRLVTSALEPAAEDVALVETLSAAMAAAATQVLGHIHAPLDGRFSVVRGAESNLGNWVCEIMRRVARTDCALINGGTLRSDLVHPPGEFTMADLLKISPYPSEVPTVRVSGQALLEALENGVSKYPEAEGRFPQVAGIRFSFNASASPLSRIDPANVFVGHTRDALAPLNLSGRYTLATTDYLSLGKDGFESISPVTDRGKELGTEWVVDLSRAPVLPTLLRGHIEMVEAINTEQRRFADISVEKWRMRLLRFAGKQMRGSVVSRGPGLQPTEGETGSPAVGIAMDDSVGGMAEAPADGAAKSGGLGGGGMPMPVPVPDLGVAVSAGGSAGAAAAKARPRGMAQPTQPRGGHEDSAAEGAQAAASFAEKQTGVAEHSTSGRFDLDLPAALDAAPRLTRMQSAPEARGPSMLPALEGKLAGSGAKARSAEPLVIIAPQLDGRIVVV